MINADYPLVMFSLRGKAKNGTLRERNREMATTLGKYSECKTKMH